MIRPRNLITADEHRAVGDFLLSGAPLSGYLAGNPHGGQAVQRLEEMWCNKFGRRHAIAVNSATSGLLAACEAIGYGVDGGHVPVAVPALSMSATAAVPKYLNNAISFIDVDQHGCASYDDFIRNHDPNAVILTTLFGHPLDRQWMAWKGGPLIIDNAQGICSGWPDCGTENMGIIVVSSFNVHKQINAGEGGIVTTDDDRLAQRIRAFINHGENKPINWGFPGLNLRMTELSAVLVLSQMARIDQWIEDLNFLAAKIDNALPSAFTPLPVANGARHGRYCYAFTVQQAEKRDLIVKFLFENAVPAIPMMRPLYELSAFQRDKRDCPVAEQFADGAIVLELTLWRYEDDIDLVRRVMEGAAKL